MLFKKLSLKNFRNYLAQDFDLSEGINIFHGENAQGKTNLLEAIYLLCVGKSYRALKDQELIKWEEHDFFLKGIGEKEKRTLTIEVSFSLLSKKKIKINGQEQKKISSLLGLLKAVIFSPKDLQLIQGAPSERRKFLDMEISQVSPKYHYDLQQYYRSLQQRNNLLKNIRENKQNISILDIWDDQLIELGSKIIEKRQECLRKIAILARLIHRKITIQEESLELKYISSLGEEDSQDIKHIFKKKLVMLRKEEIYRGLTLIGPHRDDFSSFINGIDVKTFCSQGQQRTAVLSLKLAELEFMKSESGEYPLLLLDDVMSELDQVRREHLLKVVRNKIQTFITTTDLKDFSTQFLQEARLFRINKGNIER